jgi:hypothetical protein
VTPEALPDPIEVAVAFSRILHDLGVRHVIGGSLASSFHGEPRSTNDIDILVDLRLEHLAGLFEAVRGQYYVSSTAARTAVRQRGSFNLIHLEKAVKVDLFVAGTDPLNQERLAAPVAAKVSERPEAWLPIDTVEHSVLKKLDWYRRGGETSERQWRDVVGMLRQQQSTIDVGHLREWAPRLDILDLLERALAAAGRS